MKTGRTLLELYRFRGFRPSAQLKGVWGDPQARVIALIRRSKKQFAEAVVRSVDLITIRGLDRFEIWIVAINAFTLRRTFVAWTATPVAR